MKVIDSMSTNENEKPSRPAAVESVIGRLRFLSAVAEPLCIILGLVAGTGFGLSIAGDSHRLLGGEIGAVLGGLIGYVAGFLVTIHFEWSCEMMILQERIARSTEILAERISRLPKWEP